MVSSPDTSTSYGLRDRALLELIYAAGLRVSEVAGLAQIHLCFEAIDLVVAEGKHRDREGMYPEGQGANAPARVFWELKSIGP